MAKVEIYTTQTCPFCVRAKALLTAKNVDFIEYDVSASPGVRNKMTKRAQGSSSVPQIFIDNEHIGGCDQLYSLDARKILDLLLN